jgi:cobalt-zinc-cadmium efflux system outer membrane protein
VRVRLATAVIVAVAGVTAFAQQPAPPLTLDAAIARAMTANPTIAAARLARPVATAGVAVAGERPNPDVGYEASKETPQQAITFALPIELGGKRQRRIDLAQAGVATTDAALARVTTDVRNDVRRAYFELVAANERVSLVDGLRVLLTRARDAAQVRVAAGDVPRQELLQTELQLADATNILTAARGEVAAAEVELNTLLGQPVGTPLVLADGLAPGPLPSQADALSRATQSNAELAVLDRQISEQTARRNLVQALRTPDLAAGTAFTYDAEPEFRYGWRVNFGVTVPVFTTHRAGVLLEDAETARLRAQRDALVATVSGAVVAALARATAARDALASYQTTILPAAQQVEQMAQAAYSSGQTGLVALLQALQQTRDIRQRGLEAGLAFQLALADLERAIGAPLR